MIYVRDDDVLIDSSSHKDPFNHFKKVHGWICETDKLLHIPAILVHNNISGGHRGISGFPDAIEFIREEAEQGRMKPEIHGYEHIDYAKLSTAIVRSHLKMCKEFLWTYLNVEATTWYTPWGANAPHLYEAAELEGLKLVDCSKINKLAGRYGIIQRMLDGRILEEFMADREIFFHWWEGGLRLKRVVEVLKHGSWEKASLAEPDLFE